MRRIVRVALAGGSPSRIRLGYSAARPSVPDRVCPAECAGSPPSGYAANRSTKARTSAAGSVTLDRSMDSTTPS